MLVALAKERNVEDITKINCFTAAEKTGCIPEAMTILLKYTIGEKKKNLHYAQVFTARLLNEPHFCKVSQ